MQDQDQRIGVDSIPQDNIPTVSSTKKKAERRPHPKPEHRMIAREIADKIRNGERINKGEILKRYGYSESVQKRPALVFGTKGFRSLLNDIPDETILGRFLEIVATGADRDSLAAGKEILKLKDRYPAGKLKMMSYDNEVGDLYEEDSDT